MKKKNLIERFTFWARNARAGELFAALREFSAGDVLDVGGRDFYRMILEKGITHQTWTTLDCEKNHLPLEIPDRRYRCVHADGCAMPFQDGQYDTVVNIQVLEHVFEPAVMVKEIARVLKPGGHAIFLIPQTAVLHELPQHFYNFTPYWIDRVVAENGLEMIRHSPQGGVWSSMASHLVYFFFQSTRAAGLSDIRFKRNSLFYLFWPLMAVYAVVSIPLCLLFSLGDLTEEANNHLIVARKK